jgi:hypothetical protein
VADVLAGKPSDDDINWLEVVASCISNIGNAPICVREILCQYLAAIVVAFDLPNRLKSSSLET